MLFRSALLDFGKSGVAHMEVQTPQLAGFPAPLELGIEPTPPALEGRSQPLDRQGSSTDLFLCFRVFYALHTIR